MPVIIIEADNLKSLELAIIENVQRKDLTSIEEAESYKNLIDNFNYDQEKVSKFIGKSRPHISNSLRLFKLPEKINRYDTKRKNFSRSCKNISWSWKMLIACRKNLKKNYQLDK